MATFEAVVCGDAALGCAYYMVFMVLSSPNTKAPAACGVLIIVWKTNTEDEYGLGYIII